ncbi:toxin-antitoxin system HicB family antitoxin [bacterium]|nr:toxin-antitoxin system HicB family antitoxin [bacterium]
MVERFFLRSCFVTPVFGIIIEDYIEFCAERGEEPERPFSGKFTVRISPELHRKLYVQAKLQNKSLNGWVNELFEDSVEHVNV